MERTPKHGRKTALIVILLAIVLLLGGVVGALFLRSGGDSQPTESTPPTEETPTTENDVTLFYNVDREKYAGKGEDGKTGRSIDPDTGYYHIRLAGGGRAAERRFADLKLATKADAEEVMALVTDETGLATDIIKVEDCTGGYYMGGKRLYVSDVDGNKLTLHGYIDLQGSAYTLTLDENTKIYDVSDLAEANESLGSVTTLRELDRILAIFDYDGSVGWVFVTERESSAGKETRYCEHCKQEVTWYAWADSHSLPSSGERHYFLTTDVESLTQTSLAEDASIVLDLNGHTVTGGSGKRIYSIHNTGSFLAIMDTSEQQTGKLVAAKCDNMTDEAACVWLRYGNFELYGGTLDASAVNGTKPGVAVYVRPDTTFTMYGGTIIGGTTTTQYDATKKSSSGGLGGAIFVNGTFNMHGGTISGGTAKAYWLDGSAKNGRGGAVTVGATGVMLMGGGTITDGTSECGGGNLYLGKGAVFTMSGAASIVNGETVGKSQNGGNVFISTGATLTMNGGSITGGTTRNGGGNVYLNGTLNMYGGVIRDGRKLDYNTGAETPSNTENVHLVNGTLNMTGGLIAGHMTLVATGEKSYTVNLSGAAQIKGAQDGQPNLKIADGMPIHVGTLSQGAEIWVTADGVFTTATDAANKAYFHGDNGTDVNRNSDGCLFVGRMQCVCGASITGGEHVGDCDKTLHVYKAWTSNTTLPTESGHYYLTKDVTLSKQAAVAKNATVCLDLNGHTVTGGAGKRIYSVHNEGSTLALADSGENGKLLAEKCDSMTDEGACVWVRYGTFKLYGGTLDASEVTATKSGTAVYVRPDTTFTMYGGTIVGGTSATSYDESKKSASGGMGGAIFVNGTFNMHGGTISGGTAKAYWLEDSAKNGRGGAVTVGATGVVLMDGGVIRDGTSDAGGGNLYLGSGASFTMSDSAAIVNGETVGKGQNGGSIYIAKGATFTMNGGSITGGTGRNGGGNLALYGTLNMNGGVIKDGRILDYETGNEVAKHHENLFAVNGTLNMTGGLIAGHAQLIASSGEFTANLSGTAQIKGAADGMGNLYIPNGKTINVGTMSEGAEVWVTASGVFTTATDAENKAYFHGDDGADIDRNADGCLFVGRMQCVCGASQNGGEHVGDCDKTLHAYTAWTSTTTLPTESGYYYLTENVNLNGQATVAAGANIRLDLNGHTVNGKEKGRIYMLSSSEKCSLSISDCRGTGKLVATGTGTNQGACFAIAGAAHGVKLYGGTYDASGVTYTGDRGGTVLYVNHAEAEVKMFDGTLLGGKATHEKAVGGSVYLKGKLTMSGGMISGGSTAGNGGNVAVLSGGRFEMSGGTIENGSANSGGNVYLSKGGTFGMRDSASIVNGESLGKSANGGSVCIAKDATFTMDGGSVVGGTTRNGGGNFYVNGTLNMNGGVIKDGRKLDYETGAEVPSNTENVHLVNGTLNMTGGLIAGHVTVVATENNRYTVNLSGAAQIKDAEDGQPNLNIPGGKTINVGAMAQGAEVYVTAEGVFTTATDAENKAYFHGDDGADIDRNADGCLFMGRMQCVCGASQNGGEHVGDCDKSLHAYTAWTSTTSLPTESGYYYLTKDVNPSGQNDVKAGASICLDLNGHTVNGKEGGRIYSLTKDTVSSLSIADSVGTSKLVATGTGTNQGACLTVAGAAHSVKLYGGTYDASGVTYTGDRGGTVLYVNHAEAEVKIFDGTLIGGKATHEKALGGSIYLNGKLMMSGGMISGGSTAGNGGNVAVLDGGSFEMSGGALKDGTATNGGGNVYVDGTLSVSGGAVTGGNAKNGGNVYLNGTLNMVGGNLKDGVAGTSGGNLYLAADASSTLGGTVTGGTAKLGGNLALGGVNASLTVAENAKISDGKITEASGQRGNEIYVLNTATNASVGMTGGEIDGSNGKNGAVALYAGSLAMSGGTLKGNADAGTNHGAAVYLGKGTKLTASGNAQIVGGKAANGGSVYVSGGAALELKDSASVSGGTATKGGNICVLGGDAENEGLTMTGSSTVAGGTAETAGANVYLAGGKLTMSGGTISGGFAACKKGEQLPVMRLSGNATIWNNAAEGAELSDGAIFNIESGFVGTVYLTNAPTVGTTLKVAAKTEGDTADYTDRFQADADHIVLAEGNDYALYHRDEHIHCLCGAWTSRSDVAVTHAEGCDEMPIVWTKWTDASKLPAQGYYFLDTDVTNSTQAAIKTDAGDIHLCLNGHTVTKDITSKARVYQSITNGTELAVTSCKDGAKFTLSGKNTGEGAFALLSGTDVVLRMKLYNIEIDASAAQMKEGAILYVRSVVGSDTNVILSKVKLTGGTTTATGGAISLNGGSLTLNDSEIGGGKASSSNGGNIYVGKAKLTVNNSTITGGTSTRGGNLCLGANANVTLNGATVTGGSAAIGGNIAILGANASLTVAENSKISGGIITATDTNYQRGNEIYVIKTATNASVSMTGGEIDGENDARTAVMVFVGSFRMSGGTIKGDVNVSDGVTVKLSGAPKLSANANGKALILNGNAATLEGLTDGASIAVTVTAAGKTVATGATEADVTRFVSTNSAYALVFDSTDSTIKSALGTALPD